ncbi:hypothetical protein C2E20_7234 [Micractinium conductrix]|uniref:Uncharacterized protein n=1 Tax=Micractinium conductrix TaxID=554055 RepID=A0A2P6V576_9CHLO|nr:hypothetical protein C2E20_7234 [Micractinium conductrix]|eukprot:PSC69238.1 hypothetical protein C2E20_7234 [Micractinium conductrix]
MSAATSGVDAVALAQLLAPLLQPLACLFLLISVAHVWAATVTAAATQPAAASGGSTGDAPADVSVLVQRARVQALSSLLCTCIMLLTALTKHDKAALRTPVARNHFVFLTSLLAAAGILPLLAPRWCHRHRTLIFVVARILFFSMPGLNAPRAIGNVFQGEPHGGPWEARRLVDAGAGCQGPFAGAVGQAFPGVIQLASWLLLLSFLWTLAVVLEQPGLALPSPPPLLPPLLSA